MKSEKRNQLNLIKKKIQEETLKETTPFSVFDADGTLWKQDINNIFLNYLEQNGLREVSDLKNIEFQDEKKRKERCHLFASRQAGFTMEEFLHHARKAIESSQLSLFPFQEELIRFLQSQNHKIYIVTSSIQWLVEEACQLLSLPIHQVLGMENHVKKGIITNEVRRPLVYGAGKKEKLLETTQNQKPLFAAGNTSNDLNLLEMAKIALVVNSAPKGHENFDSEQEMKNLSSKRAWFLWEEF